MQDNHSRSSRNILRGLHYQIRHAQGKLVRVVLGEIYDVAVDLRRSSPSFGKFAGVNLSAQNKRELWIPPGFAHGFYVVSDWAEVVYKATDYYDPGSERTIIWNDRTLQVGWPLAPGEQPSLSAKDAAGIPFHQAETYE